MYSLCNVFPRNTHEDGEETQKAHQGLGVALLVTSH